MVSQISFRIKGNGFPLVLIHGFCETSSLWEGFVEPLSTKFKVICPDLPGFGVSPLPKKVTFSIKDVAFMLYQGLKSLDVEQCVVIGHSLGGYVALELAKEQPQFLLGFGLFHSTAFADSEEKKRTRNKVIEFVERNGVDVFAQSFIPPLFYEKNRKSLAKEIKNVMEIAAKTQKAALVGYTKAMRDRPSSINVLKNASVPVLFVAGEKDMVVPMDAVALQVFIPDEHYVFFLDNTGHMGMFERKIECIAVVIDFVDLCTGYSKL